MTRREMIVGSFALVAGPALAGAGENLPLLQFGVITDLHSGRLPPGCGGTRYHAQSPAKLAACVRTMNEIKPDFLIELGDFKDAGKDEAETLSFLDDIEREFSQFKGARYHVLGNHDADRISKAQFLAHVANTGFERARNYYSFDRKGIRFIVLDGDYNPDGSDYDHGNFDWTKSLVPAEQLKFLDNALATAPGVAMVFLHQRLDKPGNPHNLLNAAEVRAVFARHRGKVKAVFQGHHHTGDFTVREGIPYFTFKAAVEGPAPDNNAYALVTVANDFTVSIRGYHREVSHKGIS